MDLLDLKQLNGCLFDRVNTGEDNLIYCQIFTPNLFGVDIHEVLFGICCFSEPRNILSQNKFIYNLKVSNTSKIPSSKNGFIL
jgi:hypothetical protein